MSLRATGNIVSIKIFDEARSGGSPSTAELVYKPPPQEELWTKTWPFRSEKGGKCRVSFKVSHYQPRTSPILSPARNRSYSQEVSLLGSSLQFGVLKGHLNMLILARVSATSERLNEGEQAGFNVSLILNIRHREIEVHFPILLGTSSANGPKTRRYKFPMAFDDDVRVWKHTQENGSEISYIMHVRNAPWYSRRLEDALASSHKAGARRWSEEDLWTRQTDIVKHKDDFRAIDATPISLQKTLNRINIARWTTFKFDVDPSTQNEQNMKDFEAALRDFNVQVETDTDKFQISEECENIDADFWSIVQDEGLEMLGAFHEPVAMPFALRYQLEVCISNGWICEYAIDQAFLATLMSLPRSRAEQMLVHVDAFAEQIPNPMMIFQDIRFQKPVRGRKLPNNCFMVHHATVTASGIKVHTPTVEVSNRVIRRHTKHADRFLRVKFEDDEYRGKSRLFSSSNSKMDLIHARVRRALIQGVVIAGVHYEFLAYGNSQLREHGAYFFASNEELTADMIRGEMGVFDNERIVAKRAARMGQCFSTTHPIHVRLPLVAKENLIPDIKQNGHIFSDGVGKISHLAAVLVQTSLDIKGKTPSCFQFRLGGCKGILVVDPKLSGIDVKIRPSQFKFESKSAELEIVRWSHFWQPFLNRQIILVLSNLGVTDKVFIDMQRKTIQSLNAAMRDDDAALQALRTNVDPNQMTLSMCELISAGFRRTREPFVMALLELWRAYTLKYLKEKAKIPVERGAFVLGTMDETNTLKGYTSSQQGVRRAEGKVEDLDLPEIFLQVTDPTTKQPYVVEGICIIARNPSLHQGDIRVVKAVSVDALHHISDVVVMPQNGDRDLPSMCSGGDLDGDDYIVIWDPNLIPTVWNAEPFHYEAPTPVMSDGEITTRHIIDFFVHYLKNDQLGVIAHAHLAAGDYYDDGILNPQCQELVQLHSVSVDYPKTGVPAELPRRLERGTWPHFMEKKSTPYTSRKILGQLYDDVKKSVKRFDFKARYTPKFDHRIMDLERPAQPCLDKVTQIKEDYDLALRRIMSQHKIQTEFEVWSTFTMSHSKQSTDFKFHEEIGRISKALKDEFRSAIIVAAGGSDYDHLKPYTIAAYQITAEQVARALEDGDETDKHVVDDEEVGAMKVSSTPFCSFPWLLSDILCKIATDAPADIDEAAALSKETSKLTIRSGLDNSTAKNSIIRGRFNSNHRLNATSAAAQGEQVAVTTQDPVSTELNPGTPELTEMTESVVDSGSQLSSQHPLTSSTDPEDYDYAETNTAIASKTKDPALMTEEEKAALLDDDDF
jgi:RNA-dependent RNA polymerase